jgi:hypothetical protein
MRKWIAAAMAAALAMGISACSSSAPQPEQKKLEGNRIPKGRGPTELSNQPTAKD